MTFLEWWDEGVHAIERSEVAHATIIFMKISLVVLIILGMLITTTFLLRYFFKSHPMVNRAHRVLIYVFTMVGVLALIIAGVLGVFLPVIPGIPFLLAAFFLMRKYHRWEWVEKKIASLQRLRPGARAQEKVNKTKRTVRR